MSLGASYLRLYATTKQSLVSIYEMTYVCMYFVCRYVFTSIYWKNLEGHIFYKQKFFFKDK